MPKTVRITTWELNEQGVERISGIEEFTAPEDVAKRRRHLMRRIGRLIDESELEDGPSSISISFEAKNAI